MTRKTRRIMEFGTGTSEKHPASCRCYTCMDSIDVRTLPRPELFLIDEETFHAMPYQEVLATYDSMESLGIAHLPFSHCYIGVPGASILRIVKEDHQTDETFALAQRESKYLEFQFKYWDEEFYELITRFSSFDSHKAATKWVNMHDFDPKSSDQYADCAFYLRRVLIVLLATRNAIKTRTKDKLASLGIGRRKAGNQRPLYTTTISLPALQSIQAQGKEPTGRTIKPHLRRGHIRHQKWGPRRSFMKEVWIEPCFVNADPTYVSTRVAYNTSL